ncbi:MAG: hypothetical protein M1358_07630 [Chloroflexi bacterium]|nr:hypothetical protein [Chloroflexota bacterium]
MCELCVLHGDGEKFYLKKENYDPSRVFAQKWIAEWMVEYHTDIEDYTQNVDKLDMRARTHRHQIVPLQDALKVIDIIDELGMPFQVAACACRTTNVGVRAWPEPVEEYYWCMVWGVDTPGFLSNIGFKSGVPGLEIRSVTAEQAKDTLIRADKKGLVHELAINGLTGQEIFIGALCNCEWPHCYTLRGRLVYGIQHDILKGHYVARVESEKCNGCERCVAGCIFGAIRMSRTKKVASINPLECFGCGVCLGRCKKDAILLADRDQVPVARNMW